LTARDGSERDASKSGEHKAAQEGNAREKADRIAAKAFT